MTYHCYLIHIHRVSKKFGSHNEVSGCQPASAGFVRRVPFLLRLLLCDEKWIPDTETHLVAAASIWR
jgi:hypothetical protein